LSEAAGFRLLQAGTGLLEMDLTSIDEPSTEEMPVITGGPVAVGRYPLENPGIDPIPGDPLCEPHPSEPGVTPDGEAAPLENPDDRFALDPLRHTSATD
jgi:hypothetical protein